MAQAAARHRQVTDDLRAETRALQDLLAGLDRQGWSTPTPAAGWTVQDQINHLAYFDDMTVLAATDPERFRRQAGELSAAGNDFPDRLVHEQRTLSAADTAAWFTRARAAVLDLAVLDLAVLDLAAGASPGRRIPWYGPDMSLTSAVTARLMETWAHGQDVADALQVTRAPTERLRHIAHLGVATRDFSFRLRGLPAPEDEVCVELTAPGGGLWRWGDPAAEQRVSGSALDFCLVVTQRRHLSDTALSATGDVATRWLSVAQAFAGPPGPGRDPQAQLRTEKETT